MQHKLNPEQGKPDDMFQCFGSLTAVVSTPSISVFRLPFFHLSSSPIHCHTLPGLGSPKPQREAPGAAWRTEAGSGTADLNLTRTRTLSRTHRIQVDQRTAATRRTQPGAMNSPSKQAHLFFLFSCFQVQAGQQISGTLEGLQHPKPQQGGTAQPGVEQRRRELAGPTSLSSSLSPGEKQTCSHKSARPLGCSLRNI